MIWVAAIAATFLLWAFDTTTAVRWLTPLFGLLAILWARTRADLQKLRSEHEALVRSVQETRKATELEIARLRKSRQGESVSPAEPVSAEPTSSVSDAVQPAADTCFEATAPLPKPSAARAVFTATEPTPKFHPERSDTHTTTASTARQHATDEQAQVHDHAHDDKIYRPQHDDSLHANSQHDNSLHANKAGINLLLPFTALRDWLFGGNTLVRAGVLILFIGLAFLLKYSADNSLIPLPLRYAGVAFAAIALLITGFRLRKVRAGFALALQGGAIASLYLLTIAALRLHHLLPPAAALLALILIGVFAAAMAVLQDALALALIAQLGGFLAPIITSSGGGSHVQLFSYYCLLNLVILSIAVYKHWRVLNLTGFVFTFGIGALWGGLKYQPELYASTQPFLIIFALMYIAIAVLFARNDEHDEWRPFQHSRIDGTLVFGVPLVGFSLQFALVKDFEFGAAFSALTLALFYIALASWLRAHARLKLLVESFIALAIVFGSMAIPLALDQHWSASAWAIEAAGIVWVSLRQRQMWPRLFAYVLLAGAALLGVAAHIDAALLQLSSETLMFTDALLALGFGATAYFLSRPQLHSFAWEQKCLPVALFVALLWWATGCSYFIEHHIATDWQAAGLAATVSVSAALFYFISRRINWPTLRNHPFCIALALFGLALAWRLALATLQHSASANVEAVGQLPESTPLWNGLIVGLHWLAASFLAQRKFDGRTDEGQRPTALINVINYATLIGGIFCTASAALWWLTLHFPEQIYNAQLVLAAFSALLFNILARRLNWRSLQHTAMALLPCLLLVLQQIDVDQNMAQPFARYTFIGWAFAAFVHLYLLRQSKDSFAEFILPFWHVVQALLMVLLLTWFAHSQLQYFSLAATAINTDLLAQVGAWSRLADLAIPALAICWLLSRKAAQSWPQREFVRSYAIALVALLGFALSFMLLRSSWHDNGDSAPLSYLPLLNPLDLGQLLALTALWLSLRSPLLRTGLIELKASRFFNVIVSGLSFVAATTMLLRAVHQYSGVAYDFTALWQSMSAQVALSLFWSVLALSLMLIATRLGLRSLWLCGAGLMAVVVLKLFTVDLSQVSGLLRVLSFLGVGVLLLVLGYFAPVPPTTLDAEESGASA